MLMVAMVLSCGVAQAQKVSKSDDSILFKPHWSIQLQGGAGYTIGEANYTELFSPAAALSVGWQITPSFGLRAVASGWQGKGHAIYNGVEKYSFNYAQGALDVMLNLGNLFGGYKHDRVFNPYLFLGGGAAGGFSNGANNVKTVTPSEYFGYLWTRMISPVGRGGLGADFRISDVISLSLEGNVNVLSDKFNSKKAGNPDFQFNLLAGLKINLGKPYTKKVVAPVEVLPPAPKPEAPVVKETPAPQEPAPEPAPVCDDNCKKIEEVLTFFELDKYDILPAEAAKLDEFAQWLSKNPETKVSITGYADAKTGNHPYNLRLSKSRANAVKDYLVKAGIAPERISSDYKGDTVQPFAVNDQNRVVVSLVK